MKHLVSLLLVSILIITSTEVLTHFIPYYNLLDEIILLILLMVTFLHIDTIKISKKKSIALILFGVVYLFSSAYNFYSLPPLLIKSLYYFKTFIVFGVVGFLSNKYLITKDLNLIYKVVLLLATLSIVEFIYIQFFYYSGGIKYYLWGLYLKNRDGMYRAASLTGHPISLGMMGLIALIYRIETRNKIIGLHSLIFIAAILVSGSRVPLVLTLGYLIQKTLNLRLFKVRELKMKYMYFLMLPIILTFVYINLGKYLEDRNEVAASRGMAISKGANLLLKPSYLIWGTGVGSFGTFESVEFGSPIYDIINYPEHYRDILVTANRASGIETFLFMILIEMGVIGSSLFFLLIVPFKKLYSYLSLFLIISLIVYSVAYPIYTLPYIFLLTILFPHFSLHKNA